MKNALTLLFCSTTATLFAATTPAELGNFEGVLMSGPTITQPLSLEGGTYSECQTKGRADKTLQKCKSNGRVLVSVGAETLVYPLNTVVVYHAAENHFYYQGTRTIRIGGRDVVQNISVTLNQDAKNVDRVWGFLQLNESGVRSAIEAYRKN